MRLFVIEKGSLRKISNSCMEIRVREDTWRIVREADHLILLHNNYVMTSPNTRAIVSDYHVQRFREEPTFHVIVREICTYRWKQHLIHKAKETEKRERAARKAALELALSTTYNYMPLESRSLRYQQYRFVDYGRRGMKKMKNSYPAFQILGQLPLSGGGGHLRLVTCQIPRRSKNVFLSIMEEIKQSSADSQFEPYLTVCRRMISQNDAIRLRNVSSMIERLLMMHKSF